MPINLASYPTLASIQERDLDLLLMIALNGSEMFRNSFICKATGGTLAALEKAWRGLADHNGETDVTVIYTDGDGRRAAILIEDKIDAKFQKDQGKHCRQKWRLDAFHNMSLRAESVCQAICRRLGPRCLPRRRRRHARTMRRQLRCVPR